MAQADPKVWTVAEAKARLSEVLRLSEEEGPQRIGTRKCYVVVPESVWWGRYGEAITEKEKNDSSPRKPLGQWLIENMPCGTDLEIPDRKKDRDRPIPFIDY